jgi:hypothetical protein
MAKDMHRNGVPLPKAPAGARAVRAKPYVGWIAVSGGLRGDATTKADAFYSSRCTVQHSTLGTRLTDQRWVDSHFQATDRSRRHGERILGSRGAELHTVDREAGDFKYRPAVSLQTDNSHSIRSEVGPSMVPIILWKS